jgi:threonine synthase
LSRNTAYNPLTIEGKKTVMLEAVKQLAGCLGRDACPDHVFVPAGDGVILSGVFKGLRDLEASDRVQSIPTVYAVQAAGSRAISRALSTGDFGPPVPSSTVADSLAVDVPRGGYYALKQLRQYQGECIVVSDEDILKAQRELAAECGLFAEPAASAVLAGLHTVREGIPEDAVVVLLVTGSGLKDIASAEKALALEASAAREER